MGTCQTPPCPWCLYLHINFVSNNPKLCAQVEKIKIRPIEMVFMTCVIIVASNFIWHFQLCHVKTKMHIVFCYYHGMWIYSSYATFFFWVFLMEETINNNMSYMQRSSLKSSPYYLFIICQAFVEGQNYMLIQFSQFLKSVKCEYLCIKNKVGNLVCSEI